MYALLILLVYGRIAGTTVSNMTTLHTVSEDDDEGSADDTPQGRSTTITDLEYTGNVEKFDKLELENAKKTYEAWRDVVLAGLGLAGNAALGSFINVHALFTSLMSAVTLKAEKSIWEQIERQVQGRINKEFAKLAIDEMRKTFTELLHEIAKKPTVNWLLDIMKKMVRFFPQDDSVAGYTEAWAVGLKAFLLLASAAYQALETEQGKDRTINPYNEFTLDQCSWARELQLQRTNIIMFAKAMYQKRYQTISDKGWLQKAVEERRPSVNFKGPGPSIEPGSNMHNKYVHLIWNDVYKHEETNIWISYAKEYFFNKIRDEVKRDVKIAVDAYNDLVQARLHPETCELPIPIPDDEITFSYPDSCMGTMVNKQKCALPCAEYDYGKPWCVDDYAVTMLGKLELGSRLFHTRHWGFCTPVELSDCMKTHRTNGSNLMREKLLWKAKVKDDKKSTA